METEVGQTGQTAIAKNLKSVGITTKILATALGVKSPSISHAFSKCWPEYFEGKRGKIIIDFLRKNHPELVGKFLDFVSVAGENNHICSCEINSIAFVESGDFPPVIHMQVSVFEGVIDNADWCAIPKKIEFEENKIIFSGDKINFSTKEDKKFRWNGYYDYENKKGELFLRKNST